MCYISTSTYIKIKGSLQKSENSKGVGPRSGRVMAQLVAAQLSQPSCHGVLPGGGGLHVVEPELLLHVTIGHLAKGLLVVLLRSLKMAASCSF